MKYRTREKIIDLSVIGGCIFVRFYVVPNYIEITEEYELASLSPSFFPILAIWVIAGLAGLRLILALALKETPSQGDEREEWLTPREEYKACACTLMIIAYLFAMKYIGFLISTTLMLGGLFLIQGVTRPLKVILTSICVTVGVYVFFLYVMQVHFPHGVLFE